MNFSNIKYYLEGIRRKGLLEQVKQIAIDYYYNRKFHDFQFAQANAYTFTQGYEAPENIVGKSEYKDSHRNTPSPYYHIYKAFRHVPLKPDQINLLDIGCGNGRVLVTGISMNFKSVTGIDLDVEALNLAKANCEKAGQRFNNTPYAITEADASRYVIPSGVNTIFIFNPFGADTLSKVIVNIENSFHLNKRSLFVVYLHPVFRQLFTSSFREFYRSTLANGDIDLIIYEVL